MKQTSLLSLVFLTALILTACRGTPPSQPSNADAPQQSPTASVSNSVDTSNTTGAITIKGEVWADNWSAFYLGDQLIMEDSVSINTERSFNAEVFNFEASYPMSFNFIAKDFKANDTGLEYIGSNKQQMGDGGLIAQFTDTATGKVIAVTDSSWACMVIHEAPLDKSCEKESNPIAGQAPCGFTALDEPADWKSATFDDSAWSKATVYTESQVSPERWLRSNFMGFISPVDLGS
jgi:hypothetical protein